jgi:hypothetical protein
MALNPGQKTDFGDSLTFKIMSRSIEEARDEPHRYNVSWEIVTADHAIRYLFYVILADDQHKYPSLSIDNDCVDWTSALAFTTVPHGDWNAAQLCPGPREGTLDLLSTERKVFANEEPGFKKVVDCTIELSGLDRAWAFSSDEDLCDNDPQLGDQFAPGKLCSDEFSEKYLGGQAGVAMIRSSRIGGASFFEEAAALFVLHGHGVTPRVLAYLTVHSRIAGWVWEYLPARGPTIADLAECQAVLTKLHTLGFSYPIDMIRKGSFIIVPAGSEEGGSQALLCDVYTTGACNNEATIRKEMARVEQALA